MNYIIVGISLIAWILFLIKSNDVYDFRRNISNSIHEHNKKCILEKKYETDKIDYNVIPCYSRMLFSFKKLTLENWFPEEIVNKLKG